MPEQGSAGKELSVKQEPGAEKTLIGLAKTTGAPKVKPRRRNAKADAKYDFLSTSTILGT